MARTLTEHVRAQMRAELAIQNMSRTRLGQLLGKDDTWVGKRLNGRVDITIDDLERIAGALERAPWTFLVPTTTPALASS